MHPTPESPDRDVERLLHAQSDLPPMPRVAQRVLDLTEKPSTTPADLQRVILTDPALAARVLKVANSAVFGHARSVDTLSHAVVLLGHSAVRSLVLAMSVRALFLHRGQTGLKERMMWEHALGCAAAARLLAARLGHPGTEAAFLGGLLHDIGKAVLNLRFPDEYARIFEAVYNTRRPAEEVEAERLGLGHAAVGAVLARRWNLAPELEDAIASHHDLSRSAVNPEAAAILHFANLLCERAGIGTRRQDDLDLMAAESVPVLGLRPEMIAPLLADAVAAYQKEKQIYDV